jgi:hypothetical protein
VKWTLKFSVLFYAFLREVVVKIATLAELAVKIGADTSGFEKGLKNVSENTKKVGKSVSDVGKKMTTWATGGIAAAGAGILGLASKTGDYADRVLDLQQITGMSTDSIQEWQQVAKMAGTSTESVTEASTYLTKQMNLMREGTGKQAEALERLGIKFSDLESASPDERMNMLITSLQGVEDPALRAELGADLLSKKWEQLAPVVGSSTEQLESWKQKAKESGNVMSGEALNNANNFRMGMEDLKQEFLGAGMTIASDFMPILTNDVAPFVKGTVIPLMRDFATKISDLIGWYQGLSPEMQSAIKIGIGLTAALGPVVLVTGKIIGVVGTLIPLAGGLSKALLFLSANPIGLVITGVAALVAGGVLLYKNWDTVKEKGIKAWNGLKDGIKVAANGIISYPNAILGGYESMINGIGRAVNSIPSISIPDWVPIFGGKTYSLPRVPSISLPRIPALAEGGIAVAPTLAMIGEGRESEAILPLSKLESLLQNNSRTSESGNGTIENIFHIASLIVREDADVDKIARKLKQMQTSVERGSGLG